MTAFDALERRVINLSLAGAQDAPESVVAVGLFTQAPAETHDGTYGQFGEPARGATAAGYRRARARFGTASDGGTGAWKVSNTDPITITGLPPGTYTHFGVFGSGGSIA